MPRGRIAGAPFARREGLARLALMSWLLPFEEEDDENVVSLRGQVLGVGVRGEAVRAAGGKWRGVEN